MKVKNIEVQKVIVSHCIKKIDFTCQLTVNFKLHSGIHGEYAIFICPLTVWNWETKIVKLQLRQQKNNFIKHRAPYQLSCSTQFSVKCALLGLIPFLDMSKETQDSI